jgi:uncharacterized membrane protein
MTELLEALNDILQSGIELSTIIVVLVAILKVYEGRQRRKIDEEIRRDIKAIKKGLNLCDAVSMTAVSRDSPMKRSVFLRCCTTTFTTARAAGNFIKWRLKSMNNNINVVSLTIAILGAIKIVLEAFNVDLITDDQINSIANAVAAVVTIVGVAISHRKTGKEELTEQEKVFL